MRRAMLSESQSAWEVTPLVTPLSPPSVPGQHGLQSRRKRRTVLLRVGLLDRERGDEMLRRRLMLLRRGQRGKTWQEEDVR